MSNYLSDLEIANAAKKKPIILNTSIDLNKVKIARNKIPSINYD